MPGEFDTYIPTIDAILSVSDLEQITVKKMRFALQALFDIDFGSNKKAINDLVMARYYKLVEVREQEAAAAAAAAANGDKTPSDEEADVLRKLAEKDEEMAFRLQASLNNTGLRGNKTRNKVTLHKVPKRKIAPEKRHNSGFQKPLKMSSKLAAFFEKDESETVARTEAVKLIWNYIKAHDLQNPNDKREIFCDEKMQPVFGKKQTMFSLNKVLKNHLFNEDETVE